MKSRLMTIVAGAVIASAAAPAFASGYGPAPHYRPDVGASSSQRGPSEQTVTAERNAQSPNDTSVGGTRSYAVQSGTRSNIDGQRPLYSGH